MSVPPFASPLMLFITYWLAMVLGRELPRRKEQWVWLQALAVSAAVILVLFVARAELYPSYGFFDLGWIGQFLSAIVFRQGFSRVLYITLAVVYMFIRGLGFGSRPLTLWFVGFQFRLGIVIFFAVLIGSALFRPIQVSTWIFVYFALSLFAISLARMDEMGSDIHYGPRWAMILLGGVALVFFLGLGLLQFFTLESTSTVLRFFSPLVLIVQAVILLIAIPMSFIVEWLAEVLGPFFAQVGKIFLQFEPQAPPNPEQQPSQLIDPGLVAMLLPLLYTLIEIGIFFAILYLIARALTRRMQQADDALYAREALESEDEDKRAKRELGSKKKSASRRVGDVAAESIRRIYAAMTALAGDAGIPRREAETPYEFMPRVTSQWSEQSNVKTSKR
jgi:hypothetical protein